MSFDSLSLLMVCMIKKTCLADRVRNDGKYLFYPYACSSLIKFS